jgi:uncharacterized membrane protein YfcA
VGVVFQNLIGIWGFQQNNMMDWRGGLLLGMPAIIGSILGARIAVNLNEQLLNIILGILMFAMLGVILSQPKRWLQGKPDQQTTRLDWKQILIFFAIGIYGGFIQAGVGIFLLAGLVLGAGYDLVRANAVKVFIVLVFTVPALIVFAMNDQVDWGVGFLLAIGNMVGAWLGTRVAAKQGAKFVRWLLIVIVIVSGVRFLGIWDWLFRLF